MRILTTLVFSILVYGLGINVLQSQSKQTLIDIEKMSQHSLFKHLPFENIGPNIMSGRVVDLAVNPEDPTEFYVAYASGGLWHTTDNGISFEPILDNAPTQNVGAVSVHWPSRTIWVGTGENNSSRSSYAGIGLLKSSNNGQSWNHMGLPDSHHIGRIIINPNQPDEVVVGVTGHLYTSNAERGIYKTTDGGRTWSKNLFVNENTGIIDLIHVPNNFNIQYAAAWQKDRKAWNFEGSGAGSGIYKSTDGGSSWTLISTQNSGFPIGAGVGRIGLAAYDQNTIYAVLDNQNRREKEETKSDMKGLTKEDFKKMDASTFLALDNKELNDFLKTNGFQEKYRAENVKNSVRDGAIKPIDIAKYLEDANSLLFDTPVIGAEVYKSENGGVSWHKTHQNYIDDLYYSYGYYFGQIAVDPTNPNRVYLCGVPLIMSNDGGKTFESINKENVHADHHAVWLNPNRSGHLINGNDGGINITYNYGKDWMKNNAPTVGQFYAINIDHEDPYNVYGGLQDNGVWKGNHTSKVDRDWHSSGENPWKELIGGDGMQVQIDNRNSNIVYTGFQFGNYYRLDLASRKNKGIQPKHELGESPYRFNWQTPILLSSHNQDILYLGSNKLHRSLDQGDTWEAISPDLTKGIMQGNVAYGTLTSISESELQFGLIYVGTDDGNIQMTKDGGVSWENVALNLTSIPDLSGLSENLWISEVAASKHKKERVFVTLNGYRNDDFTAYVFKSEDYGKSWENLSVGIPNSPVNALVEDPHNQNLLFVGTDNSLYVSLTLGKTWELLNNNLPAVAIHDLVIQPEAKHLIVGTHGRSIYRTDISSLEQMMPSVLDKPLHVFTVGNIKYNPRWGNSWSSWSQPNTPGIDFHFYAKQEANLSVSITTDHGVLVSEVTTQADRGLNRLSYDVAIEETFKKEYEKKTKTTLKKAGNGKIYLPKGKYIATFMLNGIKERITFEIE